VPGEVRERPPVVLGGAGNRDPAVVIWLADHTADTWGVRQVAREMNTSPSTIHRICQVFSHRLSPVKIARPHLERLAAACGETVLLAAYGFRRGQMIVVDMIDAPHPLRWVVGLNQWRAIHSGATGLAILAFLPEAEREAVYRKGLERFTEQTLATAEELEQEVARVRERGCAFSQGQRSKGAIGLGAPLFDAAGDVFGDVCITIPADRFDPAVEPKLGGQLVSVAADISADLRDSGFTRDA
jgi:DNA-binding IclR family transcriptional regulator